MLPAVSPVTFPDQQVPACLVRWRDQNRNHSFQIGPGRGAAMVNSQSATAAAERTTEARPASVTQTNTKLRAGPLILHCKPGQRRAFPTSAAACCQSASACSAL